MFVGKVIKTVTVGMASSVNLDTEERHEKKPY